jgi:hypothetical protein
VLGDHFENANLAEYVEGSAAYSAGPDGLGQAIDLSSGVWLRYVLPGWYQWSSQYDPTGKEGSVDFWINPQTYDVRLVHFNWNYVNSYPPAGHIMHTSLTAGGKLAFSTWTSIYNGPPSGVPLGQTTIPLNQWSHVAFSWGSQGSMIYVNGVMDAFSPYNHYPALNSTFYVYLPYWGVPGLGSIDELRITQHALSDYAISGRVTDIAGVGVAGAVVAVDASHSVTTDASGYYSVTHVLTGTYTLTPSKVGMTFSPPTRTVAVGPDAAGQDFSAEPLPPDPWRIMTIPNLPAGSELQSIWTASPTDTYVLARRLMPGTTDVGEVSVYHWNGTAWVQSLVLPEYHNGYIYGTGPTDVYLVANKCTTGSAAGCGEDRGGRMWRSTDGGATWTPLDLPAIVGTNFLYKITGTPGNVHVRADGDMTLRFDGTNWATFTGLRSDRADATTVFSANEGYFAHCWGWGKWDGSTWQAHDFQFDFCDVFDMWGMRGQDGQLHLYTVGSNNWRNGVRVWKFDEATQSFGSKDGYVFGDGNGYLLGTALNIWGSAPDDIYVTGRMGDWDHPTNPIVAGSITSMAPPGSRSPMWATFPHRLPSRAPALTISGSPSSMGASCVSPGPASRPRSSPASPPPMALTTRPPSCRSTGPTSGTHRRLSSVRPPWTT